MDNVSPFGRKFQYYENGKKSYSVDMMHIYTNTNIVPLKKIRIKDVLLKHMFEQNYKWWCDGADECYSLYDVLNNPVKYREQIDRINEADLTYPIIIIDNNIIDGRHRLTKAFMAGKRKIYAYDFNNELLKRFLVKKDFNNVNELFQVYLKRFPSK